MPAISRPVGRPLAYTCIGTGAQSLAPTAGRSASLRPATGQRPLALRNTPCTFGLIWVVQVSPLPLGLFMPLSASPPDRAASTRFQPFLWHAVTPAARRHIGRTQGLPTTQRHLSGSTTTAHPTRTMGSYHPTSWKRPNRATHSEVQAKVPPGASSERPAGSGHVTSRRSVSAWTPATCRRPSPLRRRRTRWSAP